MSRAHGLRRRLFARAYDLVGARVTRATLGPRQRLLQDLRGNVLEVGCGPGHHFDLYPPEANVLATDDSAPMLRRARRAAERARAPIEVWHADVHALPFEDATFDAAVAMLVLCSVDQPRALAELRRVLRPGGTLRLWEHVRSDRPWIARLQTLATPAWRLLADGCHLDRDTQRAVVEAGFEVEVAERTGGWQPAHVLLVARRLDDVG